MLSVVKNVGRIQNLVLEIPASDLNFPLIFGLARNSRNYILLMQETWVIIVWQWEI